MADELFWIQKIPRNGTVRIKQKYLNLENIFFSSSSSTNKIDKIEIWRSPCIEKQFGSDLSSEIYNFSMESRMCERNSSFYDYYWNMSYNGGYLEHPIANNCSSQLIMNVKISGLDSADNYLKFVGNNNLPLVDLPLWNVETRTIDHLQSNVQTISKFSAKWFFFVPISSDGIPTTMEHVFITFLSRDFPKSAKFTKQFYAEDLSHRIPSLYFDKVPLNISPVYVFTDNFESVSVDSFNFHFREPFDGKLKLFIVN
jgi:hypothetical protein